MTTKETGIVTVKQGQYYGGDTSSLPVGTHVDFINSNEEVFHLRVIDDVLDCMVCPLRSERCMGIDCNVVEREAV